MNVTKNRDDSEFINSIDEVNAKNTNLEIPLTKPLEEFGKQSKTLFLSTLVLVGIESICSGTNVPNTNLSHLNGTLIEIHRC